MFPKPTGIILFKDSCLLDHELHKSMVFTSFMFSFQSSSMVSPFQVYTNTLIRWGRGEKQEESRKTPLWPVFWMQLASVDLKIWKYSRLKLIFLLLVSSCGNGRCSCSSKFPGPVPWVSRVSAELVAMGVCFPAPLELEVSHSGSSDSYLITSD